MTESRDQAQPEGDPRMRLLLSAPYSTIEILHPGAPPDLAELRDQAGQAWELAHGGVYARLVELLGVLVPALHRAAHAAPQEQRAEVFRLLAVTYQACSACLAKAGERDAAWVAADRAINAAERAEDPALMAAGQFRLVLVCMGTREFDQAEVVARLTADALRPLADSGDLAATSLWGALTLQRAVIAARRGDARAAFAHLDAARLAGEQVGPSRNDYNTEFGPANVILHQVAVAADLGDGPAALSAAASVDATALSPERRGRLLVDVARAHGLQRQVDAAVAALVEAEAITPEQVHRMPLVRRLVADLLSYQEESPAELRRLAEAVGAFSA